jgi:hypothetical protein
MKKMMLIGLVIFGLMVFGCDNGNSSSDEKEIPYTGLGETFTISDQQVFTRTPGASPAIYTGNDLTVSANRGAGSGTIRNGLLTFTFVTPNLLNPIHIGGLNDDYYLFYDDLSFEPNDTQSFCWSFLEAGRYSLVREGGSGPNINQTADYIYVDRDVKITGKGMVSTPISLTVRTSDINWDLKKGWNVIYTHKNLGVSPAVFNKTLGDNASLYWALVPPLN